ncbi:MAG TPA: DUF6290 family protein [Solirubrobacteraceae bacterium]|jgi:post-segregation antitoxin (ccd killing protein)
MKAISLRISEEQARALYALAKIEGVSVSEVGRVAIADRIEKCRRDRYFQERLRRAVERDREALGLLSK